jgi:hypothetical protein
MLRPRQEDDVGTPVEQFTRTLTQALQRKEPFSKASDLAEHLYRWLDDEVLASSSYTAAERAAWRKVVAESIDFARLSVSSALRYFQSAHRAWEDGLFDVKADHRFWPAYNRLIQPLEVKAMVQAETAEVQPSRRRAPGSNGWRKRDRGGDSATPSPPPAPAAAAILASKDEPRCKWHPYAKVPHTTAECRNPGGAKKAKTSGD